MLPKTLEWCQPWPGANEMAPLEWTECASALKGETTGQCQVICNSTLLQNPLAPQQRSCQ